MGDLKYFIVNAGVLEWAYVVFILLAGVVLFFFYFEKKLNALITSILFSFSLFLFIAYGGLHPFLIAILALFWLFIIFVVSIGIYAKHQLKNPDQVARKLEEIESKKETIETGRRIVKCTHCGGKNIQFMDNNRKSFSVGKAVAGGALTGGIGTIAGFAGKKGKRTDGFVQIAVLSLN